MTRILIFAVYRQKNKLIWGIYVDLLVSRTFVQDGTIYLGAVGVWWAPPPFFLTIGHYEGGGWEIVRSKLCRAICVESCWPNFTQEICPASLTCSNLNPAHGARPVGREKGDCLSQNTFLFCFVLLFFFFAENERPHHLAPSSVRFLIVNIKILYTTSMPMRTSGLNNKIWLELRARSQLVSLLM